MPLLEQLLVVPLDKLEISSIRLQENVIVLNVMELVESVIVKQVTVNNY